jgi:hypothetical protein
LCHRLVENIHRNIGPSATDFVLTIDAKQVREIENDHEVMDHIRNRFDWTISVDDRYKVLTYALILEDSPFSTYSVKQFHDLGKSYWPRIFGNMDQRAVRGILDGMKGLGVLARLGNVYTLKSPNLLRLLGHRDEIHEQLNQIVSRTELQRIEPRNFRPRVHKNEHIFGPLTQGQTSDLFADEPAFSITLIFGNELNGLDEVPDQIDYLAAASVDIATHAWTKKTLRPEQCVSVDLLEIAINRSFGKTTPQGDASYAVINMLPDSDTLSPQEQIAELDKRLSPKFKRNHKGKLFVLVDPSEALKWVVSGVDITFSPRITEHYLHLWTTDGISRALEELKKTPTQHIIETILKETDGHHLLVQTFLSSLPAKTEINPGIVSTTMTPLLQKVVEEQSKYHQAAGIASLPNLLSRSMTNVISELVEMSPDAPLTFDEGICDVIIDDLGNNSTETSDSDPNGNLSSIDESALSNWMQTMGHIRLTDNNLNYMSKFTYNLYVNTMGPGSEN